MSPSSGRGANDPSVAPRKIDVGVLGSDEVTLLPSQVTAVALPLEPPDVGELAPTHSDRLPVELSDEELVVALKRGDRHVGQVLYVRLVRVIDATLERVIGPGQPDHDDLVQAAFEEVVRTLFKGRFQGKCRLTSWAASIACHLGLNAIRSRKTERGIFDRSVDLSDSSLSHAPRHPEPELEAREELNLLRRALATLSPGRAEAVLLHDAFGYGLAEVAGLTGSTEAAVQSRLVRGRRDLTERLSALGKKRKGA